MSTGGGCFQLLAEYDIDPTIVVNYDAVNEIVDILRTFPGPTSGYDEFVLHAKNGIYTSLYYGTSDEIPHISIMCFSQTGEITFSTLYNIVIPPNKYYGLNKQSIEAMWETTKMLEEEGWHYDQKLRYIPSIHYVYDFPEPVDRPRLIDLLRQLFTFPLTKGC